MYWEEYFSVEVINLWLSKQKLRETIICITLVISHIKIYSEIPSNTRHAKPLQLVYWRKANGAIKMNRSFDQPTRMFLGDLLLPHLMICRYHVIVSTTADGRISNWFESNIIIMHRKVDSSISENSQMLLHATGIFTAQHNCLLNWYRQCECSRCHPKRKCARPFFLSQSKAKFFNCKWLGVILMLVRFQLKFINNPKR